MCIVFANQEPKLIKKVSGNKSDPFQHNHDLPSLVSPHPVSGGGIHTHLCQDKSRARNSELGERGEEGAWRPELGELGEEVPGGRAGAREEVPHPQLGEAGHHSAWQPPDCIQVNVKTLQSGFTSLIKFSPSLTYTFKYSIFTSNLISLLICIKCSTFTFRQYFTSFPSSLPGYLLPSSPSLPMR